MQLEQCGEVAGAHCSDSSHIWQAALMLAKRHASAPQFARSMEWLLFTALEADADSAKARCADTCLKGTRIRGTRSEYYALLATKLGFAPH